jgi:hypothetical protein
VLNLEGFGGSIGAKDPYSLFNATTPMLPRDRIHSVRLDFAPSNSSTNQSTGGAYAGWDTSTVSDPNFSYGYRYLRGTSPAARPEFAPYLVGHTQGTYGFVAYQKNTVPFAAWDLEELPAQRLAVGFLENNVSKGLVDGRYWPPAWTSSVDNQGVSSPREWFFIFDRPYTDAAPDTSLKKNMNTNRMPVMWTGTVSRSDTNDILAGNSFTILAWHPISYSDRWSFNPTIATDVARFTTVPRTYELSQNFPNPFNPSTKIQYMLPFASTVELKVYNVLGQEICTLVDLDQAAGVYSVKWDGRSRRSVPLSSGVYLYRLTARAKEGGDVFVGVHKMIMLK